MHESHLEDRKEEHTLDGLQITVGARFIAPVLTRERAQ
jgi:hypothetical protein